jgi:hypothetical protein
VLAQQKRLRQESCGESRKAREGGKGGSAKAKAPKETKEEKSEVAVTLTGPVKLHLRLAFSGHEKMTEERWLKRIPTEEPFKGASRRR